MLDYTTQADYRRALRKAYWNYVFSWLLRKSNLLLPFDEVKGRIPMAGQSYRGLQEIRLGHIKGSVGRYHDFDNAFLPLHQATRSRWLNINRAHYEDVKLPPIEVFQIGTVYFVKDGNHRVSVAREKGQEFIDGYVVEIETPVPVTPDLDINELIRRVEQADFFQRTHLPSLRPDNRIYLTVAGQYEKLLEHISVHQWYLGVENQREMGWEEAVQSWYDRIYLPLVGYIRDQHLLTEFPERTEADLYLWIIAHRSHLHGDPTTTSVEEAATDFVANHSNRPLKRVVRAVQTWLYTLTAAFAPAKG